MLIFENESNHTSEKFHFVRYNLANLGSSTKEFVH